MMKKYHITYEENAHNDLNSIIYKIKDNEIIILRIFNQKQNYLNSKKFILREKSLKYIITK